jgi:predicted phosphodiesterase
VRVALISDLHGNAVSLEAVLRDARNAGADRVVCLGDVATLGPHPELVIDILRDHDIPCILGNHDAFLLDPELARTYTNVGIIVDSIAWCHDRIDEGQREFLAGFQPTMDIDLGHGTTMALYHGSPRSHTEDLLATTADAQVEEFLAGTRAPLMAGGHTHLPMLRRWRGMSLVNPGSVGMPFAAYSNPEPPTLVDGADYALVDAEAGDIRVELRHVAVKPAALRAAVTGSGLPLAPWLAGFYS